MSIKDTLADEQVKRDAQTDLSYEHETHTAFIENCYECFLEQKKYTCSDCKDTGLLDVYGGSDADDWGPIDQVECHCQKE